MEAGSQLGKYVIKDRLGRGATAEVFRALQPSIDRDVAIKVMFPHLNDSDDFSVRFQREARSMGKLQHPNIGRVIDFEASGERPYMVMEHLDGGSLQDLLDATGGPLPVPFALQITRQLADALHYANGMGMVHRDIKPANVMFTDDTHQCAMLMDFGMARLIDEGMTATGAILGTPAYIAPEQVRGEPVGAPADQYSLGVMLYEMVTGQPLYRGDSIHSLMMMHVQEPIPSARASQPAVSESLDALITTMLAKQPQDRYPDAGSLVAAIDGLGGAPAPGASSGRSRRAKNTSSAGQTVSTVTPARATKKSRGALIGAIGGVALIAAATVFALTRGGDGDTASVANVDQVEVVATTAPAAAAAAPSEPEQPDDATEAQAESSPAEVEPTAVPAEQPEPEQPQPEQPAAAVASFDAQAARDAFDPAGGQDFFATTAQMTGDTFVLAWDRMPQPAEGAEYRAMINTQTEPLGVLGIEADGRGSLAVDAPAFLASSFFVVMVDSASGDQRSIVYQHEMPAEQRAAFDARHGEALSAQRELQIVLDHAMFIGEDLRNDNIDGARRHTEHVINVINGVDGPLFGDLDQSGLAENPGDGAGVRTYVTRWAEAGGGGSPDQQLVAQTLDAMATVQDLGVRLLSADSVGEALTTFELMENEFNTNITSQVAQARLALHDSALEALIGPALALTGTSTSVGSISLNANSDVIISTQLPASAGSVTAQVLGESIALGPTGSIVVAAPASLQDLGTVSLTSADGTPLGSGGLDAAAITAFDSLVATGGLIALLDSQGQIVADHADLMQQEVDADVHSEVRRHAEHLVNIIVGESGDAFGDLDGDGAAQNPGDGVGALVYLDQIDALVSSLPADSIERQFYNFAYRQSLQTIREQLVVARDNALQVLATDTSGEASRPTSDAVAASVRVLEGTDVNTSGVIDGDEVGTRQLVAQAATLLSAPLEP